MFDSVYQHLSCICGSVYPDLIMSTLNNELELVSVWLKANKPSFNTKKTHFVVCSSKNKHHPNVHINIDGEIISETAKNTFLGFIIDSKLSWKDNIWYISGKQTRGRCLILKARKCLMGETWIINILYIDI